VIDQALLELGIFAPELPLLGNIDMGMKMPTEF
jgi:hypothetical protein